MDIASEAIRRSKAIDRIAMSAEALGSELGLEQLATAVTSATHRTPAYKQLFQLEAVADLLEAVAREVAPDFMPTINATPTALELATEQGVDLAKVEGTGVDGRILKSDVLEAVDVQAADREEAARLEAIAEAEANTTAAALKYAHENGVDLTTITGTGTGGRITLEDVKGANGEA